MGRLRRYLLILGATFGRGSNRPTQRMAIKLTLAGVCALSLSLLIARSLPPLPQLVGTHITWCATIIFVTQIAILFSLLPASGITGNSGDRLPQLLLVLPLKVFERRALLFLPGLLMAVIGLLFVGPLIGKLVLPAGMPLLLLLGSLLVGCASAVGLAYLPYGTTSRILSIGLSLAGEYKIVTEMYAHAGYVWATLFLAFAVCLCAVATYNMHYPERQVRKKITARQVIAANVQANWFLKKLLRARITGISLCLTFMVALGVGLFARKQHFTDTGTLIAIAAVLAAGFASDARAITRRILPAEITALKGTGRFVGLEIIATMVCSLASVSPLLLVAGPHQIVQTFVQLSLAVSAGIVVSTLLVPAQGDITAQILSGLCAVAFTLLPEITFLHSNIFLLSLTLACLLFAYRAEYKRNAYVWRRYAK